MNAVANTFAWIYATVVVAPLRDLFMKGPKFSDMGFWMGMDESDICSEMTRTSSEIWKENPSRCADVIDSRFESLHALVRSFLVWYAVHLAIRSGVCLLGKLPAFLRDTVSSRYRGRDSQKCPENVVYS